MNKQAAIRKFPNGCFLYMALEKIVQKIYEQNVK